jgi:hypothetical protein
MIYKIIIFLLFILNYSNPTPNHVSSKAESLCENCSEINIKKKEETILNLEKMNSKLREEIIRLGKLIIESGDTSDELAKWLKTSVDLFKQLNNNNKKSDKKK